MAIAFFAFTHKPPILETTFELVQRHLACGDTVTYHFLGHDLPRTYMSPMSGIERAVPFLPERRAARLVAHPRFTFVPRTRMPLKPLPFAVPDTLDELMKLRHGELDVGMGATSSVISQTRDSTFRPADHRELVAHVLQGALAVFDFVSDELDRQRPDLVYVFNARMAYDRSVLRACETRSVPFLIYETASSLDKFWLRPFTTHDRVHLQDEMLATWNQVRDRPDATSVAAQWFVERREGRPRDEPSYTRLQTASRLPDDIPSGRIVAYFSSSDDEYIAVSDDYRWEVWPHQLDAVRSLTRVVARLNDAHLVVRVHPHLVAKHPIERKRWMELEGTSARLTVIAPESEVDTYALVEAADVVVTGGSTVGVEAVFWGRPSILLGPSHYDRLGVVHRAHDEDELERLLRDPALVTNRDAALAYGYYRGTFGEPYALYRAEGTHRGKFMGTYLRPRLWVALAEGRQRVYAFIRSLRRTLDRRYRVRRLDTAG